MPSSNLGTTSEGYVWIFTCLTVGFQEHWRLTHGRLLPLRHSALQLNCQGLILTHSLFLHLPWHCDFLDLCVASKNSPSGLLVWTSQLGHLLGSDLTLSWLELCPQLLTSKENGCFLPPSQFPRRPYWSGWLASHQAGQSNPMGWAVHPPVLPTNTISHKEMSKPRI